MMPFADRFQSYYEHIYAPTVRNVGLLPIKGDEIYTPTQISVDIFEQIRNCRIVLADVTGKNPNVNYELGIAHALGKKAVIVTQSKEDIPFDYRHIRYIIYDTEYAGWENKLAKSIDNYIRKTLAMNDPTTHITGEDLDNLFYFLENMALDSSYELSKKTTTISDPSGNCRVEQNWTVKSKSDVTHIIYGITSDEPGAIHLLSAYDKTASENLKILTPIGTDKRIRYYIFLNKMLKTGETLRFDLQYTIDNFLARLFNKRRMTIFQKPNSRRGVFYKSRKDVYQFPATDFTRSLTIEFNKSAPSEEVEISEKDGIISISVQLEWVEPYAGAYSYEIVGRDA